MARIASFFSQYARFTVSTEESVQWFFWRRSAKRALADLSLDLGQSAVLFHWRRDGMLEAIGERYEPLRSVNA